MRVILKFYCDHSLRFNLDIFFFVQQFGYLNLFLFCCWVAGGVGVRGVGGGEQN